MRVRRPIVATDSPLDREREIDLYVRLSALDLFLGNLTSLFYEVDRELGVVVEESNVETLNVEAHPGGVSASYLLSKLWPEDEDTETPEYAAVSERVDVLLGRLFVMVLGNSDYISQEAERALKRVHAEGAGVGA